MEVQEDCTYPPLALGQVLEDTLLEKYRYPKQQR